MVIIIKVNFNFFHIFFWTKLICASRRFITALVCVLHWSYKMADLIHPIDICYQQTSIRSIPNWTTYENLFWIHISTHTHTHNRVRAIEKVKLCHKNIVSARRCWCTHTCQWFSKSEFQINADSRTFIATVRGLRSAHAHETFIAHSQRSHRINVFAVAILQN